MSDQPSKSTLLDDVPLNRFHLKMTALTFGAHFTDGYSLGTVSIALAILGPQLNLSPVWLGLLGSSALIGLFLGSLITGWISDKVGRQKIFLFSFALIAVASFLQFFVNDPMQLFILRVLIGFGIGGDYSVGVTLVTEFIPTKSRGPLLGSLSAVWTIGYVMSMMIGYYQAGSESWRWVLASAAIPALIVLLIRIGTPESPRWLIRMGRNEEAAKIIAKYIGENVDIEENEVTGQGFKTLWTKKYIKLTLFSGLFWALIVIPYFAIYTFLPTIIDSLGIKDNFATSFLLDIVLLIGGFVGIWLTHIFTRRGFLIWSFIICGVALLGVTFIPSSFVTALIASFAVFVFVLSAVCDLTGVYPSEVFPTEVRASGIGVSAAMSRLGSAIATFILPISMSALGIQYTMLILAGTLFLGAIMSFAWAPETKKLSLAKASGGEK